MDLNFHGTKLSRFLRIGRKFPESLVLRTFKQMTSILNVNDVIPHKMATDGYRKLIL